MSTPNLKSEPSISRQHTDLVVGVAQTTEERVWTTPRGAPSLVAAARPDFRGWPSRNELATLSRVAVDIATLVVANMIAVAVGGYGHGAATLVLFDAVAIALMVAWRAYAPKVRLDVLDDIRVAGASTAVAAMIAISIGALTSATVDANQVLVLWLFSSALLAAGRIGSTEIAMRRRRTRAIGMNTLIVGAGQVGQLTARRLLDHPEFGLQPVGWQAGFNAVIAMELLAEGVWQGTGVLTAESFDPDPYLAVLDRDGIYHATVEIEPGRAFA